jgi:type IV secretion system protein VirB8
MKNDPQLQAYFAEATAWDMNRMAMTERSQRIAWRVAAVAVLLTASAIIALMLLMPLKRVEPFVIRVDNTTGIVDVVPAFQGGADMPEAVTRYFLDHYVTVCERFNHATAESDYEECAAFHGAARNQRWSAQWNRANPDSPLNRHKDGSALRVQVSSISFFDRANGVRDLAQVRYTKSRRSSGGGEEQVTHWISTLQFVYGEPSENPKVRRWNPLGFKIVEFQAQPEISTPASVAVGAAS